jgi:tRNA U34 5-carboxymethylaminomethyl modifying GTPase MnmE/TrmE
VIHVIDVQCLQQHKSLDLRALEVESNNLLRTSNDRTTHPKVKLFAINKCDTISSQQIAECLSGLSEQSDLPTVVPLSCSSGFNLERLVQTLTSWTDRLVQDSDPSATATFITERHRAHLKSVVDHLHRSIPLFQSDAGLCAFHLRQAIEQLSLITGRVSVEQILDVVFRDFCIGK